jgi:hypothetical protein
MAGKRKLYEVKNGEVIYESPLVKVTQYTLISTEPQPNACKCLNTMINVKTGEVTNVCNGGFSGCKCKRSCKATKWHMEVIKGGEGRPKKIDFGNNCYND